MEFKNKPQELGEGTYQCTLDEATLEKAKLELNEDPEQRATQIERFRQWVKAQPHMSSRMGQWYLYCLRKWLNDTDCHSEKQCQWNGGS